MAGIIKGLKLIFGNIIAGFVIYFLAGLILGPFELAISFVTIVAFLYIGGIILSIFLVQLSIFMDRYGKKSRQPIYELLSLIVLVIAYLPPMYFFGTYPGPLTFIAASVASALIYFWSNLLLAEPIHKSKRNLKIMV